MADPAPLYLAWSTSGEATPAGCDHGASMRPPSRSKNGRSLRLPLQRLRTAIQKDWVRVIAWSLSLAAHKCPVRRRGALNRLVQHRWRLQQQACPNARALSQSVHSGHQKPSLRGALAQKVFPSAIALSHWPRVARKAIGRQQARASRSLPARASFAAAMSPPRWEPADDIKVPRL